MLAERKAKNHRGARTQFTLWTTVRAGPRGVFGEIVTHCPTFNDDRPGDRRARPRSSLRDLRNLVDAKPAFRSLQRPPGRANFNRASGAPGLNSSRQALVVGRTEAIRTAGRTDMREATFTRQRLGHPQERSAWRLL